MLVTNTYIRKGFPQEQKLSLVYFYSSCNAYLRNKVGNNVDVALEMNMVENAQDNTKCHLRDAQNKGQLHLVAVYKPQLVSGYLPNL